MFAFIDVRFSLLFPPRWAVIFFTVSASRKVSGSYTTGLHPPPRCAGLPGSPCWMVYLWRDLANSGVLMMFWESWSRQTCGVNHPGLLRTIHSWSSPSTWSWTGVPRWSWCSGRGWTRWFFCPSRLPNLSVGPIIDNGFENICFLKKSRETNLVQNWVIIITISAIFFMRNKCLLMTTFLTFKNPTVHCIEDQESKLSFRDKMQFQRWLISCRW